MGDIKYNKDYVLNLLNDKNYKPLSDDNWISDNYNSTNTKIDIMDSDGYKYNVRIKSVIYKKSLDKFNVSNPYSIDNIKRWLILNNRPFKLVDNQLYKSSSKDELSFVCDKCNGIFTNNLNSITSKKKQGCSICRGLQVREGINDVATVRPDLVKYFKNEDVSKKVTIGTGTKTIFMCPCCKYEKEMSINYLTSFGFSCPRCSDGISVPNKFVFGLLKELNIDFKPEYRIVNYRYDFYIPSLNMTIEAHGIQHYENNSRGKRTLQEEQHNDKLKRELSESLGNTHIEIDCRYSDYEFLKEQCMKSLSECFDLSEIDWIKVYEYCSTNLFRTIIDMFNNNRSIKYISEEINMSESYIRDMLHKGNGINVCNYDSQDGWNKQLEELHVNNQIPVEQYNLCGDFIKNWDSIKEASLYYNKNKHISECCNGKRKSAGGFIWKYKSKDVK